MVDSSAMAMTGEPAPAKPSAPSGVAQKRRAQKERATARHVQWLVGTYQTIASHHTAPAGVGMPDAVAALRADIDVLRQQVDSLQEALARAVVAGSSGTKAAAVVAAPGGLAVLGLAVLPYEGGEASREQAAPTGSAQAAAAVEPQETAAAFALGAQVHAGHDGAAHRTGRRGVLPSEDQVREVGAINGKGNGNAHASAVPKAATSSRQTVKANEEEVQGITAMDFPNGQDPGGPCHDCGVPSRRLLGHGVCPDCWYQVMGL